VQYIQFLTCFFGGGWGGGGDETFPKFGNFPKVSPKVLPKFWQNFMSSKFQKNHNTIYNVLIIQISGMAGMA